MALENIKNQLMGIHSEILLLDLQYRWEAIEYMSDCCNDLRQKTKASQEIAADANHVLNLTMSHKKYVTLKEEEERFDDFHISSFCYTPGLGMPAEELSYDYDTGVVDVEDRQITSLDCPWERPPQLSKVENGNETAVNLVMPDKETHSLKRKKRSRKQMFTRKSVRQRGSSVMGKKETESGGSIESSNNMVATKAAANNDISSALSGAFTCIHCRQKFTESTDFIRHRGSCRKEQIQYSCKHCNYKFQYKKHYHQHLDGHKQNDCKHCNKKFSSKGKHKVHMKKDHPDIKDENDGIPCKFCPMIFSRLPRLYNHYQLHHSKGKFVCTQCGLFLASKDKYREHMVGHDSEMNWKCDICNKKFYSRKILHNHLKRHKSQKYRCLTCDMTVASKVELQAHKRKKHEVVGLEPTFECDTCQKRFLKKCELKRHVSTHSDVKAFRCQHCNKHFITLHGLAKHKSRKIHSNNAQVDAPESKYEKVYQDQLICENCGKQYKTMHQLNSHQRSHKTSYFCDTCGVAFSLKSNLRRHMKSHVGGKQGVCELCGDSFTRVETLREHTRHKHSDVRVFQCQSCPKAFKRATELRRHMPVHTMARPYACFCGRAYKQSAHLRSHQKSAHPLPAPSLDHIPSADRPATCNTPLLSIGHFDDRDYHLQEAVANYEYENVAVGVAFGEQNSVSPAVDLTMVNMVVPDNKPDAALPLVNLSERIVQEYLLNLP